MSGKLKESTVDKAVVALNEVVGLLIEFLEDAQVCNSFLALDVFLHIQWWKCKTSNDLNIVHSLWFACRKMMFLVEIYFWQLFDW